VGVDAEMVRDPVCVGVINSGDGANAGDTTPGGFGLNHRVYCNQHTAICCFAACHWSRIARAPLKIFIEC
jgi:hypothetical protein